MTIHIDPPQARGRVGIASADITPPVGIYHRMWGAATHDRATGVHRPLRATVVWLEPIESQVRVILALDHCLLDRDESDRLAETAASGIAADRILVTLSHTHAAGLMSRARADLPGGDLIGPYLDQLAKTCRRIVEEARTKAEPATLVFGVGRCALAVQRDFFDAVTNQFVCGFNPDGEADDTVMVAKIVGDDGAPIGAIVNYACHPTTLAWKNKLISPDYVGSLRETVETATGAPCLFLQGASGDLAPRVGYVSDPEVADANGRQLGFAALAALEALPPPRMRFAYKGPIVSGALLGDWAFEPAPAEVARRQELWHAEEWRVSLSYRPEMPTIAATEAERARWQAEEVAAKDAVHARDCRAQVERMTRQRNRLAQLPPGPSFPLLARLWHWGDAIWLFVPGEHYQTLQTTLRARFPGRPIFVTTLTGDWQPGYIPPASTYGRGIYQESIALVAAGSAEALIESISRRISDVGEGSQETKKPR